MPLYDLNDLVGKFIWLNKPGNLLLIPDGSNNEAILAKLTPGSYAGKAISYITKPGEIYLQFLMPSNALNINDKYYYLQVTPDLIDKNKLKSQGILTIEEKESFLFSDKFIKKAQRLGIILGLFVSIFTIYKIINLKK